MIAYVTVGVDDIAQAERFYAAFLPALGYQQEKYHGDLSYVLPVEPGHPPAGPDFYVKVPFDGAPCIQRKRDHGRLRGPQSTTGP